MQRSFASMVGMPVVTRQGVRMGEIRDAWIDPSEHRVLAFVVEWEETQIIHYDDHLPLMDLVELNADVATVADEIGAGHGMERDFPVDGDGLMRAVDEVFDLLVVDGGDEQLGVVADVLFDPQDGSIRFYEITPAGDEPADAKLLAPHQGLEFRDGDALVVPPAAIGHLHDKPTPRVDIAMMRQMGLEEPQGEEDVEVVRGGGTAEP